MLEAFLPTAKLEEMRVMGREKVSEELSDQVRRLPGGLGAQHLREVWVPGGRSAHTRLAVAREVEADLIVLGTRRHTLVGELLLGSTAHQLTQDSQVPVLRVRLAA